MKGELNMDINDIMEYASGYAGECVSDNVFDNIALFNTIGFMMIHLVQSFNV